MTNTAGAVYLADPPPGTSRFDGSSLQFEMGASGVVTAVIAFIVVTLRLLTRTYIVKTSLRIDDCFIILAVVFNLALIICNAVQRNYGMGLHMWDILSSQNWGLMVTTIVSTCFYCLSITFSKLSLLMLYLQLSPVRSFRIGVWFLVTFVSTYSLIYCLLIIFRCKPIAASWDTSITNATCYSQITVMLVLSVANIVVDTTLLVLPLPVILPLQMDMGKKLSLIMLFAAGGLVCAAAITRTVIMFTGAMTSPDYTWDIIPTFYWCYIEVSTGIICASIPALRPLVWFCSNLESSRRSGSRSKLSAQKEAQPMPYSTVLSMNRKRRANKTQGHELVSVRDKKTIYADDETELWTGGEAEHTVTISAGSLGDVDNNSVGSSVGKRR